MKCRLGTGDPLSTSRLATAMREQVPLAAGSVSRDVTPAAEQNLAQEIRPSPCSPNIGHLAVHRLSVLTYSTAVM